VREIYPAHGPELPVTPRPAAGPPPAGVAALADLYRNEAGPDPAASPARGYWLRANMVASTDGAAAIGGRSGGLSGPGDRMLFTVLRSLADVILVGATTAQTERYRPVRAAGLWTCLRPPGALVPPIAVVTRSLDLDPGGQLLTDTEPAAQTIVITTESAPADRKAAIARHARIIVAGDEAVDLGVAASALTDLGYASILTEGGPGLLGQLAGADLLDELCLTISPVLAAGPAGRIVSGPPTDVTFSLAHVLTDAGYLFCRYLRKR
jgi:riboflavin biosynthesis pyrimidine reductase